MGLAGLLVTALWLRGWGIPAWTRHGWEGHEEEYLGVFTGAHAAPLSTRVVPLLSGLYSALGTIFEHPHTLIVVALLTGVGAIAAVVVLVGRQVGPAPGLLAGLLVALYGNHAFWSSSAYNVMLPHALLLAALALSTAPGWAAALGSGVLLGLAAGARFELVVYLLPAMALLGRWSWGQRAAWLLTAVGLIAGAALLVAEPGSHPAGLLAEAPRAFAMNVGLTVFLAPFTGLVPLLLAGALSAWALWRHRQPTLFWLGALALGQLSSAAFADSGFRQALLPGVALCAICALGLHALWISSTRGAARWVARVVTVGAGAAVLALLVEDTVDVAQRYYAPAGPLIEELRAVSDAPVEPPTGCAELITTPARTEGQASPFDPLDPGACFLWQEDFQHRRWTSLGVHDRAARMHAVFDLEPLGMVVDPADAGAPPRLLWRVHPTR